MQEPIVNVTNASFHENKTEPTVGLDEIIKFEEEWLDFLYTI